jgi:hypothetical protein
MELEEKLTNIQTKRIRNVIKNAKEDDINGFKKILYAMIDKNNQIQFDKLNM